MSLSRKKKMHKIVLKHRKVQSRTTAETVKTSEGREFIILYEHFFMSKVCLKWVPRFFTFDKNLLSAQSALWRCWGEMKRIFHASRDYGWNRSQVSNR